MSLPLRQNISVPETGKFGMMEVIPPTASRLRYPAPLIPQHGYQMSDIKGLRNANHAHDHSLVEPHHISCPVPDSIHGCGVEDHGAILCKVLLPPENSSSWLGSSHQSMPVMVSSMYS